jgi:hypothetical protein
MEIGEAPREAVQPIDYERPRVIEEVDIEAQLAVVPS